jgi:hypothetical protein
VLDEGVELLLSVLILVLLSADSHADLAGHVTDALAPDESVEAGVNADVLKHYVVSTLKVDGCLHARLFALGRRERQTGSRMSGGIIPW